MNDAIKADKVISAGDKPNISIAIGTYYVSKDGERYDKASDAGDGYEAHAEVVLQLECDPDNWPADIQRLSQEHSFTRKAQENFQKVRRAGEDFQQAADGFVDTYFRLLRKEREAGVGAVRIDSHETRAAKYLADILREKVKSDTLKDAAVEFPNTTSPPLTEKGQVNFIAWAKQGREAEHPWWDVAMEETKTEVSKFE